jgi:hypothetical protein
LLANSTDLNPVAPLGENRVLKVATDREELNALLAVGRIRMRDGEILHADPPPLPAATKAATALPEIVTARVVGADLA